MKLNAFMDFDAEIAKRRQEIEEITREHASMLERTKFHVADTHRYSVNELMYNPGPILYRDPPDDRPPNEGLPDVLTEIGETYVQSLARAYRDLQDTYLVLDKAHGQSLTNNMKILQDVCALREQLARMTEMTEAMQRMECDLGKVEQVIGTEKFRAIVDQPVHRWRRYT